MAYIFGLKQATKMGLSLLHSPLTATSITVKKSSGTGRCWLIQTLFQLSNHDCVSNLTASQISACNLRFMYCIDPKQRFPNSLLTGKLCGI